MSTFSKGMGTCAHNYWILIYSHVYCSCIQVILVQTQRITGLNNNWKFLLRLHLISTSPPTLTFDLKISIVLCRLKRFRHVFLPALMLLANVIQFLLYLLYLLNFFTQSQFAIIKEKGVSAALTCEWRDDKWSRAARDHYIQDRLCVCTSCSDYPSTISLCYTSFFTSAN